MSIVEFLLARIAEDDAIARSVEEHLTRSLRSIADSAPLPGGEVRHIVRWDPARVLAECKAKRAIVEARGLAELPILAAIYSDHPDFDRRWLLEGLSR